jgi:hypothetical protein
MAKLRQLSPDERNELQQLRYLAASAEAAAAIGAEGVSSERFAQEQEKVTVIVRRIKELLGT